MTQPTALFLADVLEDGGKPADIAEKCAVELRRLHAELERCKQVCAATAEGWRSDAALADPVAPVAWMHVPYPGNGMSPLVSRSEQREPSMYAASVPLYLKEQL